LDKKSLVTRIKDKALSLGFDAIGITGPEILQNARRDLQQYLRENRQAGMKWLAETENERTDPRAFFPEAKSVIVVAQNYFRKRENPILPEGYGTISIYARGRDYHKVLRKKLKLLQTWLSDLEPGSRTRIFVDSFPLMEKPLAMQAGIGWIAKNTILIIKGKGSYFFLGGLLVNLSLPVDQPLTEDYCGSCRQCQKACPTGALDAAFKIDSNKCISYLTIEHRERILSELQPSLGNLVFGCDICQLVCPWNQRFARSTRETDFRNRFRRAELDLKKLSRLSKDDYENLFDGTAVRRSGYQRFMENVKIALNNWRIKKPER
jgi:epoxyqueuosine reductase